MWFGSWTSMRGWRISCSSFVAKARAQALQVQVPVPVQVQVLSLPPHCLRRPRRPFHGNVSTSAFERALSGEGDSRVKANTVDSVCVCVCVLTTRQRKGRSTALCNRHLVYLPRYLGSVGGAFETEMVTCRRRRGGGGSNQTMCVELRV